jgi:exopolysaccharide biosynthesis protein
MAAGGRRLFLVTIDGRRPGYSVGMTLREAARLALDLGATEALNLDGGGSTTMAVRRDSSGRERYEVVNRPSDPQGERPVGNSLALVCPSAR